MTDFDMDTNFEVDFTTTDTERFSDGIKDGVAQIGFNVCLRAVIKGGERKVSKRSGSPMILLGLAPLIGETVAELEELTSGRLKPHYLTLPFVNPKVEDHVAPNTVGFLENFVQAEVGQEELPDRRTHKKEYAKAVMRRGKDYWADPLELKDTVVYIVTNSEAEDTYEGKTSSWRGISRVTSYLPKGYTVATTAEEILS